VWLVVIGELNASFSTTGGLTDDAISVIFAPNCKSLPRGNRRRRQTYKCGATAAEGLQRTFGHRLAVGIAAERLAGKRHDHSCADCK
jgi:hypothetical protein